MGAWAYCTNEDCQRGFDKPSFAEITARKRECPFCGTINHVCEDLGTALDAKFEELANLTAGATDSTTTVAAGQEANTAHESPQQRDVIVRMPNGRLFRCGCGCNVFRKLNPNNPNEYTCNACEATYEGN